MAETRARVDNRRIASYLKAVVKSIGGFEAPVVTLIAQGSNDPFRVLVSTLLSARTKDHVTALASERLFARADTPDAIVRLRKPTLEKLIFPVGFYKTKAGNLKKTCRTLLDRFDGQVPRTIEELIELPGVGRKTANLVLTEGFRIPAICVDTHVHRITNLWGYVDTPNPEKTEYALRQKLPRHYWLDINKQLVSFGQHTCTPTSPWCSKCPLEKRCPRIGVGRTR